MDAEGVPVSGPTIEVVYRDGDCVARILLPVQGDRNALVERIAAMGGDVRKTPQLESLSARERQVARGIRLGWSNRQIAEKLGIAENTVKRHISSIMAKSRLESRTQIALALVG